MSVNFELSDIATTVDALVALNASAMPVMTMRDNAAWVMNLIAHDLGAWLVQQDTAGNALALGDARKIRLQAGIGSQGYLSIWHDAEDLPAGVTSAPAAAFALARVMAPAVNALAYAGSLAPRALWRIAGDGLAWGWTQYGDATRGRLILTAYGAPFVNRQLTFDQRVTRRGGCCRYVAVSGQICSNCPLNKPGNGRSVIGTPV